MIDKKIKLVKEDKIDPLDNYERLWKCRDFEISNLWQRSVFLATFMVLLITGYGIFFSKYILIENQKSSDCLNSILVNILPHENNERKIYIHLTGLLLCFLGDILSILWIMMAKGSKYWYESYEASIDFYVDGYYGKLLQKNECPYHGNLPTPKNMSWSIFNPSAFRYSVSNINAVIGMILYIGFVFLGIFHFTMFISHKFCFDNFFNPFLIALCFTVLFQISLFCILYLLCSSGEINEN